MKPMACIHCGIDDSRKLAVKKGFTYVRCRRCSLVYLNPRPGNAELNRFYNTVQNIQPGGRERNAADARHNRHKIKKFRQAIDLMQQQGRAGDRLLDLGCATGLFMEMAERGGWQAYGTDVKETLVQRNRKRFGNRVKLQAGHRLDFEDGFFDVVTLFDVIEHLPDPVESLKEVARVLRPGGLVIISTPDIDGLLPRWTYRILCRPLGIWEHPEPPGHLFQFSFSTLSLVLGRAGLVPKTLRNFEIFIAYSVSELEEAAIERIKTGVRRREQGKAGAGQQTAARGLQTRARQSAIPDPDPIRAALGKLPRLLIRLCCWALVLPLAIAARTMEKGDAMIVVATRSGRPSAESAISGHHAKI